MLIIIKLVPITAAMPLIFSLLNPTQYWNHGSCPVLLPLISVDHSWSKAGRGDRGQQGSVQWL